MEENVLEVPWLVPALLWITGVAFGYVIHMIAARMWKTSAQRMADELVERAKHEADVLVKEAGVKAQGELQAVRDRVEQELAAHRRAVAEHEQKIVEREALADGRAKALHEQALALDTKKAAVEAEQAAAHAHRLEVERTLETKRRKLEELSGLSAVDARTTLLARVELESREELARAVRKQEELARGDAEKSARRIITTAIERYALEQVSESTTTTVALPSEEMKGRIIGREGRNHRSLEAALGVNVIVDDTPGVVVISSFDPVRRELAKRVLEILVVDGRIQPARIEEVSNKVQSEMEAETIKAGELAAEKLGVRGLDSEVVKMLGRLRFRHSYGQNVLQHSVEMAHLMTMMAGEIGLDAAVAARCGLLHDIGKVLPQDAGAGHAVAGAEFLRRHGETPVVVNAVAAHHGDVPGESWFAELTRAGDIISGARPGARMESTEIYLKRLEKLEELARSFPGVTKCYALEAGREIRVLVEPAKIDDTAAVLLARDLSRLIAHNIESPAPIKVVVIRETRVTEYAR